MYKLIFDDYAQNINEIDVNGLTKKKMHALPWSVKKSNQTEYWIRFLVVHKSENARYIIRKASAEKSVRIFAATKIIIVYCSYAKKKN